MAAYVPRAGYPRDDFIECLGDVRSEVLDAQSQNYPRVLGGDFNAEIGRGRRSAMLLAFAAELDL
eukprot:3976674-Pyramimonas_sp.AAC.1